MVHVFTCKRLNDAAKHQLFQKHYIQQPLERTLLVENVLAGASAIVWGVLADRKGRKRLALMTFVLLGVGYALLGFLTITIWQPCSMFAPMELPGALSPFCFWSLFGVIYLRKKIVKNTIFSECFPICSRT
jgi:hypothetical protein